MKAMKRILALTMTLAMVAVLVMAMPAAYAEAGITASVSGEGPLTISVAVTDEVKAAAGIEILITPPSGFTYVEESETAYSGFEVMANGEAGDFYIDNTKSSGIDIPAGSTILTVQYTIPEGLEPNDYIFNITIGATGDAVEFGALDIEGAAASATYTVEKPEPEPTPSEPVPSETTPAETTPAETTPAETTPATATPAPTATPKPVNPNNPTTGDESNLTLYVVIMFATLALGAVTFVVIRKGSKA